MNNPSIGFISLGCPKALVDSERILTQLKIEGYQIVPNYKAADLVVVNTCGFIDSAKQESIEAIGEAIAENGKVIVTGCLGVAANEIRAAHPQVLHISGPHQYEQVLGAVHQHLPPRITDNAAFTELVPPQGVKLTPRHYAYLKISEGCNHRCSFCIIPSIRGDLVSRPAGEIMTEAQALVKAGVKELLVISQDTSAYGVDLKYKTSFWNGRPVQSNMLELSKALGELGIWIRMHYIYPYPNVDQLIPLMAEGVILPYLDIPFQHAHPDILKQMKRPAHQDKTLQRIHAWREICPDITLRSTFVVGFPGETEAHFQYLLEWMTEAQLDRVGCFEYSPVKGATANQLPNPIPEDVKHDRWERLMAAQQTISIHKLKAKIGSNIQVLIDEVSEQGLIGRSHADAPEIDGLVYLEPAPSIAPGDWVSAHIHDCDEYDLYGQIITTDNRL